jgi:putative heme-binding domain-containing protein
MSRSLIALTLLSGSLVLAQSPSSAPTFSDAQRLTVLSKLVHDPSPKTRLEALRGLARVRNAESVTLALSVLEMPMDPTLDYGLWLTINDLSQPFVQALQSGAWKPEGRERQLEFALLAIPSELAGQVLGKLLESRTLDSSGSGPWIELIGRAGTSLQLRVVFDRAVGGTWSPEATARALVALAEAVRQRKAFPEGDLGALAGLFTEDHHSDTVRSAAFRLAILWKERGDWVPGIKPAASAPNTPPAVRSSAFEALRAIGGKSGLAALDELVRNPNPEISRSAAVALAGLDINRAVPSVVEQVKTLTDEAVALDFWRAVLSVKGAGRAIADALPDHGLQAPAARAGMRAAREGGRSELDLVLALARGSGLTANNAAAGADLIKDLATGAATSGDANRGEWIFRRNETACLTCHGIGGAGGKVGPDLTSIGASAPMDYLVESVVLPNAKIKEGYHAVLVTTKDGNEHTGTLARETGTELILRLASGAEESIAKAEIQKREQGVNSLMPAGLLESLNSQEQLDLFAFLSRLGKPGDYDAAKGGVARHWLLTQTVHTDGQEGKEYWPISTAFTDKRWKPVYALVRGVIPRQLLLDANGGEAWTSRLSFYAATEFTVAQTGAVQLNLTANPAAELWVDGKKLGRAGVNRVELSSGLHRVVVQIDPKNVPENLRLESADVSFVLN